MPDKNKILFIALIISICPQIATDVFLPSLPAMTQALATSSHQTQKLISYFLIGFGAGQFFYGPLSDRFGRKPLLLLGYGFFVLASFILLFMKSIHGLLACRIFQGFGIASGIILMRAILRDILDSKQYARFLGILIPCWTASMVLAPVLGGYIQDYLGWRANFILLFGLGLIIFLLIVVLLPETLKERKSIPLNQLTTHYKAILMNVQFNAAAWIFVFLSAGLYGYSIAAPYIVQRELGLSPVAYGWLSVIVATLLSMGALLTTRLLKRFTMLRLMGIGLIIFFLGALLFLIFALLGLLNLYVLMIPLAIIFFGQGMVIPTITSTAMQGFSKHLGFASSLLAGIQLLGSAIIITLFTWFHVYNQRPLAVLLILLAGFALVSFLVLKRHRPI